MTTSSIDPAPEVRPPEAGGVGGSELLAGLDGLDASAALAVAQQALRTRRAAEVAEMRVAAHWAVLHGEPVDRPDGRRGPMVSPGGDGTPAVREYAVPELAMARESHPVSTRNLVADTLDLMHRLPATWALVVALECESWVARRVAVLSRPLPLEQVGVVDRGVAAAIAGHAASTVLEIAEAKVMEADPEAYAMRREEARRRRYVSLSRSDEFGYRHLIARITAGDAAWIDAMVDRVADILALTHGHEANRDELRSMAMGWLARPADLLRLLLDHTETPGTSQTPEGSESSEEASDSGDPAGAEDRDISEDTGRPAWLPDHVDATLDRLSALSTRQLAALRGRGTVFVHLTDRALHRQAGLARIEGMGPMLAQALAEVLGHADVKLQPVLDLAGRRRVDAYEHPDRLKDHTWTQTGGDVFPYVPRTATRDEVDFDHPTPYRPHGPPGQTGPHNSGPLRRRHHRWKTFAGYRCRQAGPGRFLWQTPHGLCLLVDHSGTHHLTPDQAEIILTPDVDAYLLDVVIDDYAPAPPGSPPTP